MALWGQGDKRWIVEEREDAKNVNNWHWSEVDASAPSKKFFNEKFTGLAASGTEGNVRISEVTTCNGEASVNNRKGKVIYFFEWNIVLKWTGKTETSNDNLTGKIEFELSEENSADEVDITTSQNKTGKEHSTIHAIVKSQLVGKVRDVIEEYIRYLQVEHGKQVILPTKKSGGINAQSVKLKQNEPISQIKKQMDSTMLTDRKLEQTKKTEDITCKRESITITDKFQCCCEDLFQCFVNPDKMKAYFQGAAEVDPRESGKFSLLGGSITGTFLEVKPQTEVAMHWRFKDWPEEMYSSVNITFKDTGTNTELKLVQSGIPKYSVEQIRQGWYSTVMSEVEKKRKRAKAASGRNKKMKSDDEIAVKKHPRKWTNKQRVLVFSARGITFHARHLMNDLKILMPHSKSDSKFERKEGLYAINEICEMKNCNMTMFLEMRKKLDLYMWLSMVPNGPSARFLVQNVHTMDELRLTGNHLKYSRPLVTFDKSFDDEPFLSLLKEMLRQMFPTPNLHPKSKPFYDHVISFTYLDERIWFRNYQITNSSDQGLVEVGPRFCLWLIKIFDGSFSGNVIYDNPNYKSPNQYRAEMKQAAAHRYKAKVEKGARLEKTEVIPKEDEFDEIFHTITQDELQQQSSCQ